jgi:thiol:disulfide interchange protein DsbA
MNTSLRSIFLLVIAVLTLAACTSSSDKPTSTASTTQRTDSIKVPPQQPSAEYTELAVRQTAEAGKKVEVVEFFAYFCSHCKSFDPMLSEWARKNADHVVFKRVPVAFRDTMIPQQRMYYALEAMGKLDDLHGIIFEAIQVQRLALDSDRAIFDFVVKQNIDATKFKELYESFAVRSQSKMASEMQRAYNINSVPNIAIDGRFITSASHASQRPGVRRTEEGLQTATLQIMDDLVAKVQRERQSGSPERK